MTYLGLADAVNAPEALLQPGRVPRKVVVDHEVGALQVDALASGVGGHQDQHLLVLHKRLLDMAPIPAPQPTVNGDHGFGATQQGTDTVGQVVERIAVFAENDELASLAIGVKHLGLVLKQAGELGPFAVLPATADALGQRFQLLEPVDFGLQLGHSPGSRCQIHHLLGGLLELLLRGVFELIDSLVIEHWKRFWQVQVYLGPPLQQLGFSQAAFQALPAAMQ